jgi:hypothetical protein
MPPKEITIAIQKQKTVVLQKDDTLSTEVTVPQGSRKINVLSKQLQNLEPVLLANFIMSVQCYIFLLYTFNTMVYICLS